MTKAHKFKFQIAYADTDAGGITYHARYIEIAERARMNWVGGILPPDGDIGFVIKELNVKYIKPLNLGNNIIVETRVLKMGSASLHIEHKFVKDDETYAIMTGVAAYVGSDLKPKRIPETMVNLLEKYKN